MSLEIIRTVIRTIGNGDVYLVEYSYLPDARPSGVVVRAIYGFTNLGWLKILQSELAEKSPLIFDQLEETCEADAHLFQKFLVKNMVAYGESLRVVKK